MKRWLMILPVLLLMVFVTVLALRLAAADHSAVPQTGARMRPVPDFEAIPLLPATPGFATADLKGRFILVNVFATWCAPCQIEHPRLLELSRKLPVYGIAFGDKADAVAKLLKAKGNPFTRINDDPNGTASISWGVRGVPESFLIAPDGHIIWTFAGPITATQQAEIETLIGGTP
jgi:cytochrome c biogenesis protein CcmG/thiol:disulfide interchange protein DsbE